MRIGITHKAHRDGGIVIYVYEEDSGMWVSEHLVEPTFDTWPHSVDALVQQTTRELEATLRFNLEMPLEL